MTADTVGGIWTFAMDLCAGLIGRGTRVTLVAIGPPPDAAQSATARRAGITVLSAEYRLEWMEDCERDVTACGQFLLNLADKIKPDLIHANGFHHAALPFSAPVLLTAHSCVASWWLACKGKSLPPAWDRYGKWVGAAVRAADMVVAPTAAYLDSFQHLHGQARDARVIWNGRDPAGFCPGPKHNFVLAAGRVWDEAKNIGTLCRAAQDSDISLLIAGEAVSPHGRRADTGNAKLLGRIDADALARHMREAAIFASAARYEPFGLAILEAALSGCALVLADIPPLRELWDGAATFVPPDDVAGWRRVLRMLSHDREAAEADGRKAEERARRYSAAAMTQAYLGAYRAVPARGRALAVEAAA